MQLTKLVLVLAAFFPPYLVGEDFESLIANSPFVGGQTLSLTSKPKKKAVDDIDIHYELRGILIRDGVRLFNIYNPTNNKSEWVRQGDSRAPMMIDSFDAQSKTLYFHTSDGKSFSVKLKNTLNNLNGLGITFK
ncbi:MAG: hypothetical protein LBB17_00035 [Puniceicoccales bacterium]|jgi:hypothetical protein|nr:hypothetical protein [Puniceicoccales bacterium]